MITEAERFNTKHPDLCPGLRWKGMFVQVEQDPTVPSGHAGLYWCVYTQKCIGPDGDLAEPGTCLKHRSCHGTGECG